MLHLYDERKSLDGTPRPMKTFSTKDPKKDRFISLLFRFVLFVTFLPAGLSVLCGQAGVDELFGLISMVRTEDHFIKTNFLVSTKSPVRSR